MKNNVLACVLAVTLVACGGGVAPVSGSADTNGANASSSGGGGAGSSGGGAASSSSSSGASGSSSGGSSGAASSSSSSSSSGSSGDPQPPTPPPAPPAGTSFTADTSEQSLASSGAAYGQASHAGEDPAAGLAYVKQLISHVPVQDKSGRDALNDFTAGNGDVLLSYEYEATTAQKKGQSVDYVLPDDTIKIDIDIAATKKASASAKAFLAYVLSKPAQQRFADWGYRPVDAEVLAASKAKFPDPPGLFTIDQLGGWTKVDDTLFDPDKGAIAKIESAAGVSTAK